MSVPAPTQAITPETQKFRQNMGHVSRHSAVFFAGIVFNAGASYVFKIYLARELGARNLGLYALGFTLVNFLGMVAGFGLPGAALRFVASYAATQKTALLRGFLVRGILLMAASGVAFATLLYFAGAPVVTYFYHAPELKTYLGLLALSLFLSVLGTFLMQSLAGYKDVAQRTVIANFIGSPAGMVFTIILVSLGLGLWGYMFAQVLGAGIVVILGLRAIWKRTPRAGGAWGGKVPKLEREVVSFSAVTMTLAFLDFFVRQADKVLLGVYMNAKSVGIYSVAIGATSFVPLFLRPLNQVFTPTISDLHARQEPLLLARMFQTITKWIVGLTTPLVAAMIVFAAPLMRIFGADFAQGWPVVVICACGQLVNCGVGSAGNLLLMTGHQKNLLWIQGLAAAVMVGGNLALVPVWGIVGAAVAAAASMAMSNLCYLVVVRQKLRISPYNRSYERLLVPLLASSGVLLAVRLGLRTVRPEWLLIVIGTALAYGTFIAAVSLFGLDEDDRVITTAIWKRIRNVLPGAGVQP